MLCFLFVFISKHVIINERKSEQAHIPHAPPLLDNAAHYAWQHTNYYTTSVLIAKQDQEQKLMFSNRSIYVQCILQR